MTDKVAGPDGSELSEGLGAGAEAWEQMRTAVLDALIVGHIYRAEHEVNPRKALADLLAWETQIALDPAVSSAAADLIRRHTDALRCALEALDYCIEDSAELLNERMAQWGSHRKDRQAAMAEALERHRAVAERLRALVEKRGET